MKLVLKLVLLTLLFILTSCGNDPIFDDSDRAKVTNVSADDNSLILGQATVVSAKFSFSSDDVFNDNNIVSVVLQIPKELSFRLGTGEIQSRIGKDNEVGAVITNCPNGEQYLLFELDDNDLSGASNPSGDADAELTVTVDSNNTSQAAVIQAFASRDSAFFACDQPFEGEDSEVIRITQ